MLAHLCARGEGGGGGGTKRFLLPSVMSPYCNNPYQEIKKSKSIPLEFALTTLTLAVFGDTLSSASFADTHKGHARFSWVTNHQGSDTNSPAHDA